MLRRMTPRFILMLALALTAGLCLCACTRNAEIPDKTVSDVETATTHNSSTDSSTFKIGYVESYPAESSYTKLIQSGIDNTVSDSGGTMTTSDGTMRQVSTKTYTPTADSDKARTEQMQAAIDDGCSAIVVDADKFSTTLSSICAENPDVQFLLVDGQMTENGTVTTATNVHCVAFHDEQAGYLLGYALTKEGYKGLGFCGGTQVEAVQRFGYGFIRGVDAAATEMGSAADTYLAYWYTGTFAASDSVTTNVDHWYTNGVDVVFSCNGDGFSSVLSAATTNNKPLAAADVDRSSESSLVLTGTYKDLEGAVNDSLTALIASDGTWDKEYAGITTRLGVADKAVGLYTDNWRLKTFTVANYQTLYDSIANGTMSVSEDLTATPQTSIQLDVKSY